MAGAPELSRRRLATELQTRREELNYSQRQVELHFGWSTGTLSKYENRTRLVDAERARELSEFYGITDRDHVRYLVALARESETPHPWLREYGKGLFPPAFRLLLGMEAEAGEIGVYQSDTWPALVQTEAYARAVLEAGHIPRPPKETDQRVRVRLERQEIFRRTDAEPVRLRIVIGEAALRYVVGSAEIRREQLKYLLAIANKPGARVTIQVIPFVKGAHAAMGSGPITVVHFLNPKDPPVVYAETLSVATLEEDAATVRDYTNALAALQAHALSPADSRKMIRDYSIL